LGDLARNHTIEPFTARWFRVEYRENFEEDLGESVWDLCVLRLRWSIVVVDEDCENTDSSPDKGRRCTHPDTIRSALCNPDVEHAEIRSTHLGFGFSPTVYALAAALIERL